MKPTITEKQATDNLKKVAENQSKVDKFLQLKEPIAPLTLSEIKKECERRDIPYKFTEKKPAVPFTNEYKIKFIKKEYDSFLIRSIRDYFISYSKKKQCFYVKSTKELYRLHDDVQQLLKCIKRLKALEKFDSKEAIEEYIFPLLASINTYQEDFFQEVSVINEVNDRIVLNDEYFISEFIYTPPVIKKKRSIEHQ